MMPVYHILASNWQNSTTIFVYEMHYSKMVFMSLETQVATSSLIINANSVIFLMAHSCLTT